MPSLIQVFAFWMPIDLNVIFFVAKQLNVVQMITCSFGTNAFPLLNLNPQIKFPAHLRDARSTQVKAVSSLQECLFHIISYLSAKNYLKKWQLSGGKLNTGCWHNRVAQLSLHFISTNSSLFKEEMGNLLHTVTKNIDCMQLCKTNYSCCVNNAVAMG